MLIGITIFLGVWLVLLTIWVLKNSSGRPKRGEEESSLGSILQDSLKKTDGLSNRLIEVERVLKQMRQYEVGHIQKWAIVKFNPFEETGGGQSFVTCFLNEKGDGVVISSLHGRAATRVYAKSIKGWDGEQKLSKEEEQVIEKARHS